MTNELAGEIVKDCVNQIGCHEVPPFPRQVPAGFASQEAQQVLPDSTVMAALHRISAITDLP